MNKWNAKRIAALVAVVLLVAMYLVTLVAAFFDNAASGYLFRACLICTIVIPVMAWGFIWLYGHLTGKKTIADLHLMQDPQQTDAEGEAWEE